MVVFLFTEFLRSLASVYFMLFTLQCKLRLLVKMSNNWRHSDKDSTRVSHRMMRFVTVLWRPQAPKEISRLTRITHATEKLLDGHGDMNFNFTLYTPLV
jgi:hypothetical protein